MVDGLLRKYRPISDQVDMVELRLILREFEEVLRVNISGDVCEFGCYNGTTSLYLGRLIKAYKSDKRLWLYDSFEGLPEKSSEDEAGLGQEFRAGELKASKKVLLDEFGRAGLPRPIVKKSWFNDLTLNDVPSEISFAFLDGDYYKSIKDSFNLISSRLSSRATVVVDDYGNDHLPGAQKAVDEWRCNNKNRIASFRGEVSLAIFHMV